MATTSSDGIAGIRLGDFEIGRELGRGGMGVVYEARQVSLNRKVALKVLGGGLALSHKAILRFRREAEAAAKLHHTNIVPVYAIGEDGDRHFYAMELIEGLSLDRVLDHWRRDRDSRAAGTSPDLRRLAGDSRPADPRLSATIDHEPATHPPGIEISPGPSPSSLGSSSGSDHFDRVARMVAEVADALDYAHSHGVVHRDIKPSNLLLSPEGRLSLNDFGLARVLEGPGLTLTGEFVGTPAYMSPEQVTAGRAPLDHRTDIYSLGATLYELLTLRPPFAGLRRDQVIGQIISKEPPPPHRLNKRIPRDLETICVKAMEKDPDRRYQTAGALAEDLRRFVARHAINARRLGPVARLVKWARRRPGMAAALGCALAAVGLAGVIAYRAHVAESYRQAERRQQALDKALVAAMSAKFDEALKALAEGELLGASTGQVRLLRGQVAYYRGDTKAALDDLEQACQLMPENLAARAMLAMTYMAARNSSRLFSELETLDRLSPVTGEDFLYKGLATSILDPREGVALLDEAIRRRDSPIARLSRAHVRTEFAFGTDDPSVAESALKDVRTAADWLPPNNPIVLSTALYAQMAASFAYEERNDLDRSRSAREQAGRDAAALAAFPSLALAREARLRYMEVIDDHEGILAEWEHARRGGHKASSVGGLQACSVLYGRGDLRGALDVLDQLDCAGDESRCSFFRLLILAEQEGKERARAAYWKARETLPQNTTSLFFIDALLLLLGDAPGARRAYLQSRQRGAFYGVDKSGWYDRLLDYNCGLTSAEQLTSAAGSDRRKRCEAHYFIALTCLADGDCALARKHFEQSAATKVMIFGEYHRSRMFLSRMAADPAWPRWISAQK